jgi:hypothetical protein
MDVQTYLDDSREDLQDSEDRLLWTSWYDPFSGGLKKNQTMITLMPLFVKAGMHQTLFPQTMANIPIIVIMNVIPIVLTRKVVLMILAAPFGLRNCTLPVI